MKQVNSWRIMWVLALFDFPTGTKQERHRYTVFRQRLLERGFTFSQYSVYLRHYPTFAKAKADVQLLVKFIPAGGKVSFYYITDKQFGMTTNYYGRTRETPPKVPEQVLLF